MNVFFTTVKPVHRNTISFSKYSMYCLCDLVVPVDRSSLILSDILPNTISANVSLSIIVFSHRILPSYSPINRLQSIFHQKLVRFGEVMTIEKTTVICSKRTWMSSIQDQKLGIG